MKKHNEEWTVLGRFLREYTYFTKSERRAIIVLLLLTLSIWTLPTLLPYFLPGREEQLAKYTKKVDDHFAEAPIDEEIKETSEQFSFKSSPSSYSSTKTSKSHIQKSSPSESFVFDPNTLPKDSLRLLGLPDKVVNILDNYRSKGGKFFKKNDLLKVYGFKKEDYKRLEPFIKINEALQKETYRQNWKKEYSPALIDINAAEAEDWQKLKGIGPYYSSKIVNFRNHLGGFSQIKQVSEVYGLPDSVYQKIKPYLQCQNPKIRKIPLDSSGIKLLSEHPYISNRQANGLAAFIDNHGPIEHPNILKETGLFTVEELEKLLPYLQ